MTVDERDLVVELLSSMKKFFKFKELEKLIDLTSPTIWRYVHGEVKPSAERARVLLAKLLDQAILEKLREKFVELDVEGFAKTYELVYNIDLLNIASIDAYIWSQNLGINCVATVEVDGIALATLTARRLNSKLIVIKKRKEVGYQKFHEVSYVTSSPPEVVTLYLPNGVIEYGEKVLVVDDVVRSGRTSAAVFELIKKAGGRPVGFYALLAIGNSWKQVIEKYVGSNYKAFFQV
ncbi:MAG: adenine phosphoribosyltransferase [Ignisphaera sp.]|nr:adenine phosphoribosyltransferase [Ignisphaera sp.]